jgi:hypothetical protein
MYVYYVFNSEAPIQNSMESNIIRLKVPLPSSIFLSTLHVTEWHVEANV